MRVESYIVEAHLFRMTNNALEFLLLKRSETEIYPGIWQMVTGSVHDNENAFDTALREIKEETGLIPVKFWVVPHMNSFYSPQRDSVCMVPVFAGLISIDDDVRISVEHSEFKWVVSEEARKMLAWDGQRKSVDIIEEYFLNQPGRLKFVDISDKIILNK